MNISIKNKIYLSFFLLVFLFVGNGIASIITLHSNRKLSDYISRVIDPALESTGNFEDVVIQSKINATNWVFLRSDLDDKDALKQLQDSDYPQMKSQFSLQLLKLNDAQLTDSINKFFAGFEQLIIIEKKMMASLQTFKDYDDPVKKLEGERMVEDELLPRTSELIDGLDIEISYLQDMITEKNSILLAESEQSRSLIFVLAVIIICIGVFLSL